jgi:hypothetical protein
MYARAAKRSQHPACARPRRSRPAALRCLPSAPHRGAHHWCSTPWLLADGFLGNQFPIHIERGNRGFRAWFPGKPVPLLYRFPSLVSQETNFPPLLVSQPGFLGKPVPLLYILCLGFLLSAGCGGHINLARCSGLAATVRASPAAGGVPYVDAGENLTCVELQIYGDNMFEVVCASPQIRIFYQHLYYNILSTTKTGHCFFSRTTQVPRAVAATNAAGRPAPAVAARDCGIDGAAPGAWL